MQRNLFYCLSIYLFCICFSGCALFWGKELPKTVNIKHISSQLIFDEGVGDNWDSPQFSLNGNQFRQLETASIELSTWDTISIKCIHIEIDDVYSDYGSGVFSERIWKILKEYGSTFSKQINTVVYEQRSASPSYTGMKASWLDSFEISIID